MPAVARLLPLNFPLLFLIFEWLIKPNIIPSRDKSNPNAKRPDRLEAIKDRRKKNKPDIPVTIEAIAIGSVFTKSESTSFSEATLFIFPKESVDPFAYLMESTSDFFKYKTEVYIDAYETPVVLVYIHI